jgi:GMP synthase-like glutamine amidotransferase
LKTHVNINVLQHAAHEGPGEIEVWAHQHGHQVAVTHLYSGDALPSRDSFDLLVVMGGEMNIYQYRQWPWLKPERELIEAVLAAGKPVIGICLGAQLIADALGSRVTQNAKIELGWQPITFTPEARAFLPDLPETATVLHWHEDTFELPEGATRLATSAACSEQGYVIPGKCLGLQFHMEVDANLAVQFVHSQGIWPEGPYVQLPEDVIDHAESFHDANRQILFTLLDRFCAK